MITEISEFKGRPTLVLKRDENDSYPFSFGVTKAKLVVEGIEAIKKFIAEYDESSTTTKKDSPRNVEKAAAATVTQDDDNLPF